ncbi:MAG: hypothetical protein ACJAUP_001852 [Cellvibrionaceae bacterium]|jgi:hypothetical protein
MVLLDGLLHYDEVSSEYKADNPARKRTIYVESISFVAGLLAAGLVTTFVLIAVPGGLLIALIAGGIAAVGFDNVAHFTTGKIYDEAFK